MRRRMKLFPMLVAAFVMIACTIITLNRLDTDIAALEDVAQETKLRQLALESEQSAMRQELALKDTDSYIMEKARTLYGYLMPGEIRFEVSNPDSLYDTPEAIVVGEGE
ncbi:MAG: septum formation initiator family protein [Eubacteriales bacterium]|nr:septum formation initiator family protein [Eubacteriales bacterium]